jgi:hypothetical protein
VVLRIARDSYFTAIRPYAIPLWYGIFSIVRAFGMDPRTKYFEYTGDIGFVKHHYIIHTPEGGDKSGAFLLIQYGALRTFDRPDGAVAVDRNDQGIAQLASALKVAHVANVQNIEAAIGENNTFSAQDVRQFFQQTNFQVSFP